MKVKQLYDKGQYFTVSTYLQTTVNDLIYNSPTKILEPSCGRGDLIQEIIKKRPNVTFDLYEIDDTLQTLHNIDRNNVRFCDFLACTIDERYDTIVSNPPFIKQSRGSNLYMEFLEKCFHLLRANGELICIVPSEFFKMTSSSKLINMLLDNGDFTHVIYPNNERLFENALIDILIFRYSKQSTSSKSVIYNGTIRYIRNTNGIITFSTNEMSNAHLLKEFFDIYVGFVTGNDKIFKNASLGNVDVLNGKDRRNRYILIQAFPSQSQKVDDYLLSHKQKLMTRRIKHFDETNWFEWGAMRNYKHIVKHLGSDCIYIYTVTRSTEICFQDKVGFFSGALMVMIPKCKVDMHQVIHYLNSAQFRESYTYAGRFKIGQKQLCNASVEFSTLASAVS